MSFIKKLTKEVADVAVLPITLPLAVIKAVGDAIDDKDKKE